jgi:mannan endo-1,4-beta-mannosidase
MVAWSLGVVAALVASATLSGCVLLPIPDRHGVRALEEDHFLLGAWLGEWPGDGNPEVKRFAKKVGFTPDLIDVYLDWYTGFSNVSHALDHIANQGALPVLTWEPHGLTTHDILEGKKTLPLRGGRMMSVDEYLADFSKGVCKAAARADQPVLIRTLHEMNGNWFSWGLSYEQDGQRVNSDASYRQAWIKIHDAFHDRCGQDVLFVFAVNHFSVGPGASFTGPYPGDEYVDFMAIDGYNWGSNAEWGWQTFDVLFSAPYCAIRHIPKPILVAEIASTERGGDKAAWIQDMFSRLPAYPQIRGLVWFNHAKYEIEIKGNMDWPVDSSDRALESFRTGAGLVLDQRENPDRAGTPGDPC